MGYWLSKRLRWLDIRVENLFFLYFIEFFIFFEIFNDIFFDGYGIFWNYIVNNLWVFLVRYVVGGFFGVVFVR